MEPCMYCEAADPRRLELMTKVADLSVSSLHWYREQTYPGRCVLVFGRHVKKLTDLTEEEHAAFFRDVRRAAAVITELYRPDKLNYLIFGDLGPHLHIHIVPKYADGADWGEVFRMAPQPPRYISPEGEAAEVERIRARLAAE